MRAGKEGREERVGEGAIGLRYTHVCRGSDQTALYMCAEGAIGLRCTRVRRERSDCVIHVCEIVKKFHLKKRVVISKGSSSRGHYTVIRTTVQLCHLGEETGELGLWSDLGS